MEGNQRWDKGARTVQSSQHQLTPRIRPAASFEAMVTFLEARQGERVQHRQFESAQYADSVTDCGPTETLLEPFDS